MKAENKKTNIVGIIIALMMVFLCAINVTYAYFTTQHSVQSTGNFSYMSVMWYTENTGLREETTISITPSIDKINRGENFTFSNTGAVSIYVTGVSAYVRFWVDAYVVTDELQGTIDDSQNFGKYFELDIDTDEVAKYEKASNSIYYIKQSISNNNARQVASSITFALNAPDILMTKTLKISISFDAVQAQNKAYKKVFDDSKGYYADWE